jgi:hypothetical protein
MSREIFTFFLDSYPSRLNNLNWKIALSSKLTIPVSIIFVKINTLNFTEC